MTQRTTIYIAAFIVLSLACILRWFDLYRAHPKSDYEVLGARATQRVNELTKRFAEAPPETAEQVLPIADSYRVLGMRNSAATRLAQDAQSFVSSGDLIQYEIILLQMGNLEMSSGQYPEAVRDYTLVFDMDKSAPDAAGRISLDLNDIGVLTGFRSLSAATAETRERDRVASMKCFTTAMENASPEQRQFVWDVVQNNIDVLFGNSRSEFNSAN